MTFNIFVLVVYALARSVPLQGTGPASTFDTFSFSTVTDNLTSLTAHDFYSGGSH